MTINFISTSSVDSSNVILDSSTHHAVLTNAHKYLHKTNTSVIFLLLFLLLCGSQIRHIRLA